MTPVFELKNVNYYYDDKQVLENINIKINKGEFLAIVGPNGAGKSTLLK
ncbi:Zinc ABC transporter, ATP-binding protein ZnuC, partial [Staphylococcus simiae CCM 7213 = CCUG 51256]